MIVTAGGIISTERLADARNLKASRPYLSHLPDHHVAAELAQVEAGEREFENLGWEAGGRQTFAPCEVGSAELLGVNFLGHSGDDAASSRDTALLPRVVPDLCQVVPGSYDEQRASLRHECNQLAQRLAQELGLTSGRVHQIFGRRLGFRQPDATIAQLQVKADLLRQRVSDLVASGEHLVASGEHLVASNEPSP